MNRWSSFNVHSTSRTLSLTHRMLRLLRKIKMPELLLRIDLRDENESH
jgi:hypothetical protein